MRSTETSPSPASPKTLLVDASPYIFRAYFSLPSSMRSPAGEPVAAVYGFAGFLCRLIADEAPSHLALAFDESLNTSFRNELYPAYKAQRDLPPPELEAQLAACQELAQAMGAATFVDSRYEADDLLATLVDALSPEAGEMVIVSSDKDLAQLVSPEVVLYDFAAGARLGPAEVEAKFGVRPEQVPDLLGLAGDSVDNIPGVAGIGAKTAAALLRHFGSLDALYARLQEVATLAGLRGARSVAAKLAAGRERALLSRELATVSRQAPARPALADLAYRGAEAGRIAALFDRLGFGKLRERIPRWRAEGSGAG